MQGEFFKGDIKDVCAELQAEAQRCKGMTVGEWLQLRKRERLARIVAAQMCAIEQQVRGTNK